jgi:histidine triad (HIT) family protein
LFSKKIAKAIEKAIPCKRIGVAVIGLEVPHAHIHLIPLNNVSDINFSLPKLTLAKEELWEIAHRIRANVNF